MTLERYAALERLLEPFGGRPLSVDGDRIVYQVSGSAQQLRAQLGLAKLQEVAQYDGAGCSASDGSNCNPAVALPLVTQLFSFYI